MMPEEPPASITPSDPVPPPPPPPPVPVLIPRPEYRWYHKASAVLFVTFCLELGFFLLIFPWTDYWESNFFSSFVPEWHQYWENLYVRGAISGLGVINLFISFVEIVRLRRFARR